MPARAQVSVYDTINSGGGYSRKVRRLGEFHPELAPLRTPDAQDIDDPLYGNTGGPSEEARHTGSACAITCIAGLHRQPLQHCLAPVRLARGPRRARGPSVLAGPSERAAKLGFRPARQAAVREALRMLHAACEGLAEFLAGLRDAGAPGAPLRAALCEAVQGMESNEWLVPPKQQAR